MSIKTQMADALKTARAIAEVAVKEKRAFTDEEQAQLNELNTQIEGFKGQIKAADQHRDLVGALNSLGVKEGPEPAESPAQSLGEHFVKSGALGQMKGSRFTAAAPEFVKQSPSSPSSGDVNLLGDLGRTDYGIVVDNPLRRPTVADLLASGTISGSSLTYWTQGATAGGPKGVAEGAEKPQVAFSFGQETVPLTKIAAYTKISDEMREDAPYLVSVINNQLVGMLAIEEEDQILNGTGGSDLTGILAAGIGAVNLSGGSFTTDDNIPAVFEAIMKVQSNAQLAADGIVMHPTDYQAFRLSTDANGQYFGGGPFAGQYGNGGIVFQPPLWGVRTVVTSAISQGTVLVGAFSAGAQLFTKGGVRVEATNSNEDDFIHNIATVRAEKRGLLAVYRPNAFVKVTLSSNTPS